MINLAIAVYITSPIRAMSSILQPHSVHPKPCSFCVKIEPCSAVVGPTAGQVSNSRLSAVIEREESLVSVAVGWGS